MTHPDSPAPAPAPDARIMTPAEVARAFRVDAKTVTRWAAAGRLRSFRTPAGHRRYWRSDVDELIAATTCGQAS